MAFLKSSSRLASSFNEFFSSYLSRMNKTKQLNMNWVVLNQMRQTNGNSAVDDTELAELNLINDHPRSLPTMITNVKLEASTLPHVCVLIALNN